MESTVRGLLEIEIKQARDLPNLDKYTFLGGASDSYVKVKLDGVKIAKTRIIQNDLNPRWNQNFWIPINHIGNDLTIEVIDDDIGKNDTIGTAEISFRDFVSEGGELDTTFPLTWKEKERGEIDISLRYSPFCTETKTGCDPKIPGCYFPLRENCKVTLYQDAEHWRQDCHESIVTGAGEPYSPRGAWRDILQSLESATKFIFITGWSVFTEITLVRDEGEESETLGEVLKRKSEEGVSIFIMIWDEFDEMIPSLMGTHDTETAEYFEDTGVTVKQCARRSRSDGIFAEICYSHHQKSVICDAPSEEDRLRIVAYVGGLDLTNGRYDTPQHELYCTLNTQHAADFYQNCAKVRGEVGPRQPWHDIHCFVEGKVAQDVLQNFQERWLKEAEEDGGELYPVNDSEFLIDEDLCEDDDCWNVQFLRSITNNSCIFTDLSREHKLKNERSEKIENSIHVGYIHQIRRAKSYIYIENQYFLGSSHIWEDDDKPKKAVNLIPIEITKNIIESIKEGTHHAVYIIIPMYPEGDPTSMPVQEILYWQASTVKMMYKTIAQVIDEEGLDTHPTDYLAFYCVAKRGDEIPDDLAEPEDETEALLREKDRFPIYVHSKMMITDDEYIIVGSANINQRSMSGRRDTEIAVGCYQPNFLYDESVPQGDVAAFRKSLWCEHLGELCEEFDDPGSIDCIREVNEIARENWNKYVADDFEEPMQGHLLAYPYEIGQDGSVTALEGSENFPDTEAPVLGTLSGILMEKLTT